MADTFRWPLDDEEVEALDLENNTVRPIEADAGFRQVEAGLQAGPDDDEFPVESKALVVPIRPGAQKVEIKSVVDDDAWFPSEDGEDAASVVTPSQDKDEDEDAGNPETRREKAVQTSEAWQELRSRVSVVDSNRRIAGIARWALPLLGLIVVMESGWLLAGVVAGPKPAAAVTAPVATPVAGSTTTSPPDSAASSTPNGTVSGTSPATSPVAAAPAAPSFIAPSIAPSIAFANLRAPETTAATVAVPAPNAPGAALISLPFQVQVFEGGRFIGIIDGGPLALSPGSHTLRLVNESMGFNVTQSVTVAPTKTTRITVPMPTARVQLNAVPWAEVTIDGKSVGETPLGNVPVSIGPHTFVFRNPMYREQTRTIVVSGQGANRISVDLTQ